MMRRVAVVLLCLLFLPVPAHAEEVDQTLVEDDANDVMIQNADGSVQQADGGQLPNVDLLGVGIFAEDADSVTFFVEVKDIEASSQHPAPFHDPDYHIYFNYGEQGYRVMIATALQNAVNDAFARSGQHFARLEVQATETSFRSLVDAEVEIDHGEERIYATVPRYAILDHNQAPLGRDRTIEGIWAEAQSGGWFEFPVGQFGPGGEPVAYVGAPFARDQAPDDNRGVLPSYTFTTGPIKARGGLAAGSDDPVRWTNGEASTLVFNVAVTNTDSRDIPVTVDVNGADPGWTLAYSDSLTIPQQSFINVTFLVSIPFSHNHGAIDMFEATFTEVGGNAYAAADLGVYWPAVPQPAGHHDTIWLHSLAQPSDNPFSTLFDTGVHAWMSAIEDEDQDEQIPIPSQFVVPPNTFTGGKALAFWSIQLEPGLRMGLDFRPEDLGTAEIAIDFPAAVVDPVVSMELTHVKLGQRQGGAFGGGSNVEERTPLASASTSMAGPVSGRQTMTFDLEIEPEADDIPYEQDVNLVLQVLVEATFVAGFMAADPAGITPRIIPGGSWMQLPLNEYETPLDISFQTDGAIEIAIGEEGVQRQVNPGRTVVYTFEVFYWGANTSTMEASISGPNAEWASIVGDSEFTVGGETSRIIGFAVTAPKDARANERADLTLRLVDVDNAAIQSGVNTVTTVVTEPDIPDESHRAKDLSAKLTADKESPGIPLVMLLAAILLARRK